VNTRQLLVPWGERRALLRDEERPARLEHHVRGGADRALVLASTGEPGAGVGGPITALKEPELQRILDRAGLKEKPAETIPSPTATATATSTSPSTRSWPWPGLCCGRARNGGPLPRR
jgi:hypothetical protein